MGRDAKMRQDGSVESANTPLASESYDPIDYGLYRVLITEVLYVDDKNNTTKGSQNPEMQYNGVIIGGKDEGILLTGIRDAISLSGGKNNYSERVYKANTQPLTGPSGVPSNKQDGDVVYVAFLNGNPAYPLIVGRGTQHLDEEKTGATKEDGPRFRWEYNGIFFEVNKEGVLTLTRKGGQFKSPDGFFEPEADGDKVSFKLENSKLTTTFNKDGIVKVEDGENEKYDLSFKSGLKVSYDGKNDKATFTTSGGAVITADGKGGVITIDSSGTSVKIDSNSGTIDLLGDFVNIGSDASDFAVLFTELANAFNAHTHPESVGGTTGPPTAPLLTTVGSQSVKVQP